MIQIQILVQMLKSHVEQDPIRLEGGILLCSRPYVAPKAYLHRIYTGLPPSGLNALERRLGMSVPLDYRASLGSFNGARLFGGILSLGGYVRSLSRSAVDIIGQPISLDYGNLVERPAGLNASDFVLGGLVGNHFRGNLVMASEGGVRLVDCRDGSIMMADWPDLDTFLLSEISRLSARFDRRGHVLSPPEEEWLPATIH